MSLRRAPLLLCLLVVATACARPGDAGAPRTGESDVDPGQQRYRAVGTVLEGPDHGPQLCYAVAQSLPPQCGGPDIVGWDWAGLDAESRNGVTWGDFVVTGTWDGTVLTLSETPRVATADDRPASSYDSDFSTPCDPPAGGWAQARGADDDISTAQATAGVVAGYGGLWVDDETAPGTTIVNVTTTGDPAAMRAAVRRVWAGPLCVSAAVNDEATLLAAQQALLGRPGLLGSGPDTRTGVLRVQVYVAAPEDQAAMDAEFGAGVVVLDGFLRPVS